jgi:hypothetical protein
MDTILKDIISKLWEFHKTESTKEYINYGIKFDDLLHAALELEVISHSEFIQVKKDRIFHAIKNHTDLKS